MILKPLGESLAVTTEDTVYNSKLVRIFAKSVNDTLVTIKTSEGEIVGSFHMPKGVELVEKNPTDTISANHEIQCTPVAYYR